MLGAMSWSKFAVVGLVATGALLTGCTEETVGSDVIRTGGMWAEFTVTATRANEANAKAALRVGGRDADTLALLVAPDALLVAAAGEEKNMTPSGCENNRYCAKFSQNIGGEEVVFNFYRGEGNENAPESTVRMPEPFTLSAKQSFERGKPITFTWDGEDDHPLSWEIRGNCIWNEDGVADDDGSYSISPDRVRTRSNREDDECNVTLTVKRTATGSVDSRFAGGTVQAVQERTVTFISYPEGGDEPDPTTGGGTDTTGMTTDTSEEEGGVSPEAGSPEAGTPEAGAPEAGAPEAGSPEAGSPEAGSAEGGSPVEAGPEPEVDGGVADAGDESEDGGPEADGGLDGAVADSGDAG